MAYKHKDGNYRRAQREGFVARSVYKLEEIDRRFGLVRRGDRVLDLGCAPGSWLQYLATRVGPSGRVLGVDLGEVRAALPRHVQVMHADVYALTPQVVREALGAVRVVLSDLAPHTTGIRDTDALRSAALAERALALALGVLEPGGHFACKLYMGPGTEDVQKAARARFESARWCKPAGSRKESREIYLVASCARVEACPVAGA
jgi:23S rRNA (uridine2552-2'-O)-methyltransferase